MTTCLGIRNATHWADARSTERISCNRGTSSEAKIYAWQLIMGPGLEQDGCLRERVGAGIENKVPCNTLLHLTLHFISR